MVNGEQIRAARAWLGWTQDELSERSRVSKQSITRFESGVSVPYERTIRDLARVLEDAGVEFLFEGSRGVGLRVRGSGSSRPET
jgi:transcriptional regulator with XRE-family HTH domain